MNKQLLILSGALLLSACNNAAPQPPLSEAPLTGARIGGAFTLTDQDGEKRSRDEFGGKWRMVYFGYTACPDICTPDMQNLMAGLKLFAAQEPELAANIQPIFITVDPARDTPQMLTQFVRAFHPRLIGLTGSHDEIAAVAKAYAVAYSIVPGGTDKSYLVSHTQTPFLMDPDGKPVAVLPANQPGTGKNEGRPEAVANELARWVR
ncbi:MAG: SCO family protein [Sphingorhabdus sp.]